MRYLRTCSALCAAALLSASTYAGLKVVVHATGFFVPLQMIQDPTDPNVQFVVQQTGVIRAIVNGQTQPAPFLDLTSVVTPWEGFGSERGLLGLEFHPRYNSNRYFFVNYTDSAGDSHIVRYTRSVLNPLIADPASAYHILGIAQPYANHNGGCLKFGPDTMLYIGMGDGGAGEDPGNRAQTITNMLLGKMLRLDIDGDDFPADPDRNYRIPPSNPFVNEIGDDEIWDLGLRNPWRFGFDNPALLGTGALVIGDVGQGDWEEIDYEPAGQGKRNYGWRVKEGSHFTGLSGGGNNIPFTDPIFEYPHGVGEAITGGYVCRAAKLPDQFGRYFYSDFDSGKTYSLGLSIHPQTGEATVTDQIEHTQDLGYPAMQIASIDVDSQGMIYIMDYFGGRIWRVEPEGQAWPTDLATAGASGFIGTTRHLMGSEDRYVCLAPVVHDEGASDVKSILRIGFKTDLTAASLVDILVEARGSRAGNGVLDIGLKNWNTGAVDYVASRTLSTTDHMFGVMGVPAGGHVRADGRIEVYLGTYLPGGGVPNPYGVYFDLVSVKPS